MDEDLILETTFLIDLERERHRGEGSKIRDTQEIGLDRCKA